MAFEFKFPDVGEGIHEGEIVKWRVAVGEQVKGDQPLVEMETAKAIVELPSPKAGTILALIGKEGETIHVGATLVVIGEKGEAWIPEAQPAEAATTQSKAASSAGLPRSSGGPGVVGEIPTDASGIVLPPRKPEVQKITSAPVPQTTTVVNIAENKDPWGAVERTPVKGLRKVVAQNMVKSAFTIPHVTHMDEADAGALVKLRESKKPEAEKLGIKLTFLPYIIKAAIQALKKYPGFNAAFEETAQEIVYKKYYNIGIAVDTPEGLMVPVIKNADQKDIFTLAKEIVELAQKCRDRKITIPELEGGTFSITNIGSVGGIFATPIVLFGQTADLGVLKMKDKPVAIAGKIEIRPMLTLALSFDHRVTDGADAARFMNEVILAIENFAA